MSINNSGNKGNRGKFTDRLKLMRLSRLKLRKGRVSDKDDEVSIKNFGRNVVKVFLVLPSFVYSNVTNIEVKKSNKNSKVNKKEVNEKQMDDGLFVEENEYTYQLGDLEKEYKLNQIRDIDISFVRKMAGVYRNDGTNYKYDCKLSEDELKKISLQKEIISLIKKKLVNSINQLEILQSELYVLNQVDSGNIYLDQCREDIKEIKKLLSKVKALKEKYDYLKDTVDFEYMLEYGDNFLIDKILELKELCYREVIKQTVEDYKILDEYKYLYLKIDKFEEDVIKFEENKKDRAEKLKQRDIDFDKLKEEIYDVDVENDRYNSFVSEQQLLLNELNEKMFNIDMNEMVSYKLKGFNQLLGNSFKYLGLLLVNPLKGLIPGIATETLVTKNLVYNLYKNLEWEENRKIVYDTIDFSDSINNAINNLDSASLLVDSTLEEIVKLKSRYMNEFSMYEGYFSSYNDAIKKINKMENAILGNKIKIEMMRQRMKEKEMENKNKLEMVKKLNSNN